MFRSIAIDFLNFDKKLIVKKFKRLIQSLNSYSSVIIGEIPRCPGTSNYFRI